MRISWVSGVRCWVSERNAHGLLVWLGAVFLCTFLTACQVEAMPQGLKIQVQQVITGRELEIAGVPGQPEITERVRLEGIDAPDLAQHPWGNSARIFLQQAIAKQAVLLESDQETRDERGDRLAYVWQNGVLLNEKLVAEGFALAVPHPPNGKYDLRLAHAQDRARALGLGIWDLKQPMRIDPATFRQGSGV